MFKHLLSKRTYIVVIFLSCLILGGMLSHYYSVVKQNQEELERAKAFVQYIQAQKEKKYEQQEPVENSLIHQNHGMSDTAEIDNITQFNKTGENTLIEEISQSIESIPKKADFKSWFEANFTEEDLINLIESDLKEQGIPVLKMHLDNGLVYPIIKNTLYVEWGTYTNQGRLVKYIARSLGTAKADARLSKIWKARGADFTENDIPPDLLLIDFKDAIDPYEYLLNYLNS